MITDFIKKLKDHIRETESDWMISGYPDTDGCGGEDMLDMDKLLAEIDKFAATFKKPPSEGDSK